MNQTFQMRCYRLMKCAVSSALIFAVAVMVLAGTLPQRAAAQEPELLDRVLVIAGESVVMESEMEERLLATRRRLQAANTPLPDEELLRSRVLDQLILESLIKQRAVRSGIQVTSDELTLAASRVASEQKMSEEEFYASFQKRGESYDDFLTELRENLTMQKVQQAEVGPLIRITEEEIDSFLASSAGETLLAREYLVHHIMLGMHNEPEAAKEKAADLLQKLEDGESFEALAAAHSEARSALEGGALGWRKLSQLPELIANALPRMSVGEIAGPLDDGFALHLVRLSERRGDTVRYAEEANIRHILLKPGALRTLEEAKEELDYLRLRIVLGDDFASLAQVHSEDPNSALSGGDLGWVQTEQLPILFQQALEGLEAGDLSEPFQTDAGWHVAQVLGKRTADLTESTGRNRAYRLLYERKYEEEVMRFVYELRHQAYVEMKDGTAQESH